MAAKQGPTIQPNYRIRAVERALDILESFKAQEPSLENTPELFEEIKGLFAQFEEEYEALK